MIRPPIVAVALIVATATVGAAERPVEPRDHDVTRATVRLMTVTLSGTPAPLNVGQQRHSAFPGIAQMSDGAVHLVWRQGSDHVDSRDGVIYRAISHDSGRTFDHALIIRAGGADYRDPSLSLVDGAAYLTWFTGVPGAPAQGAFMMREWGEPRRMDGGLPYAAVAAPLVRLPNGLLGGAFYGRKPGESIDTVFVGWSWDGGWSWGTNRAANSIGANVHHNEPWVVVDGAWTHVFFRDGPNGIAMRSSSNSLLSDWTTPRRILNDATGRPTTLRMASGTLVMVYRQASTGAARMAFSLDHGASWRDGGVVLPSVGGIGMTYAALFEPEPGKVRGVVGREGSTGVTSQLYGFDLVER